MVISMACFAIEDSFIKLASETIPVGEILVILAIGGAAAFSLLSLATGQAPLPKAAFKGYAGLRSLFEAIAAVGFVSALALVPISLVTTIIQVNPILVALGAVLFFNETVGWRRWLSISFGLLGVLIVLRPFGEAFELATLFAVMGVIAQTGRDLVTRRVKTQISSMQLSTAGFAAILPAGLITAWINNETFVVPSGDGLLFVVGAFVISLPGLYTIIASVRIGDMSFVVPFRYSRIIFGLTVGLFIFNETLDTYTIIGAVMIIASGLYTLFREARLRRASLSDTRAL